MAYVRDIRGDEAGQCSGTVVAPNLVLTAGHCVENVETGVFNEASGYRVITDNVNIAAQATEEQLSSVTQVIACPCFDRNTRIGDAALLELSTPTTAPTIELASSPRSGSEAILSGWGDTFYKQPTPVEQLRWAKTVVQSKQWCEREAPPFSRGSELCTIDPTGHRTGLCNGDSGGPLLMPEQSATGGMVQIGVASHGYDGCATASPSVFTATGPISGWVRAWAQALAPTELSSRSLSPPAIAAPALAGVAGTRSLAVGKGVFSLRLSCDQEGGVCTGVINATIAVREELIRTSGARRTVARRTRKATLANDSFAIAPGASAVIRSPLSSRNRSLLSLLRGKPLDVTLTGQGITPRVVRLEPDAGRG